MIVKRYVKKSTIYHIQAAAIGRVLQVRILGRYPQDPGCQAAHRHPLPRDRHQAAPQKHGFLGQARLRAV